MLTLSQGLNPGCEHVLGDMRTVRLGRTFDIVFVHDAIAYMVTETDLVDCLGTAFAHLRPGGVALFVPDHTRESFHPSTDHGGHDGADGGACATSSGRANRRPATQRTRWTMPCSSRSPAVRPRSCTIITSRGCFPVHTWLYLLEQAGFVEARLALDEPGAGDATQPVFIGMRPG